MKRSYIIISLILIMALALIIQMAETRVTYSGDQIVLQKSDYYQLLNTQERFEKLLNLEREIERLYYQDPETLDLDTALYRGLFSGLDRYSRYYTADEYARYQANLSGEFVGIGIEIELVEAKIRIDKVYPNSPAEKAELKPGDIIEQANGVALSGLSLDDALLHLRGEAGTPLELLVRSEQVQRSVTLYRAKIVSTSVTWELKPDQLGYIRIAHFEQPTAGQFKAALAELMGQDIQGLVIDLRANPGGYLSSVVDIADQILGATTIVTEVSRSAGEKGYSSQAATELKLPYVILVNASSASASEILAAAVQDTGSGIIIGETTAGKGVVQTAYQLQDGSGFRITSAYYLTPAGRNIHEIGVAPDIDMAEIEAAGYASPEQFSYGDPEDGVLNYALDYLLGAEKP